MADGPAALPVVALVGRPNVGKSTLFNRLVGAPQAVVESVPGTTRDRLYGEVEWAGRWFLVVDTGGLTFDPRDSLRQQVTKQVHVAIAEADAIILVVDVTAGPTGTDEELAALLRQTGKPVLLAVNKADSERRREAATDFYVLGIGEVYPLSAYHGTSYGDLLDALVAALPPCEQATAEDDARPHVAIVGRPNVGKSLLLNRLLGEERTVVSEAPGTTRDAIDTVIAYREQKVVLIDTAGIRRRGHIQPGAEKYGVLRSLRAIRRADVALLVTDGIEPLTAQDTHIGGIIADEGKGAVLLVNKWDLVDRREQATDQFRREIEQKFRFMRWMPTLFISALTGLRVGRVLDAALAAAAEREHRIPTGRLNDAIGKAVAAHPPALIRRRQLKVYYAAQVSVGPPTFVLFVNDPALMHFSYRRYLENAIRRVHPFRGTSVRLVARPRARGPRG